MTSKTDRLRGITKKLPPETSVLHHPSFPKRTQKCGQVEEGVVTAAKM